MCHRYEVAKTMLRPPLFDPSIPEDKLADWVDSHTMRVHQFLHRLQEVIFIAECNTTSGSHCIKSITVLASQAVKVKFGPQPVHDQSPFCR